MSLQVRSILEARLNEDEDGAAASAYHVQVRSDFLDVSGHLETPGPRGGVVAAWEFVRACPAGALGSCAVAGGIA
jgi:hypothetical protein